MATGQPSSIDGEMDSSYASGDTLPEMFWRAVELRGSRTFMREKRLGLWHEWTWIQAGVAVREVCLGLVARGLRPGDGALIVAETSVDWVISDMGILSAGGVSVGIHRSCPRSELLQACADNRIGALFIQEVQQAVDLQEFLSELEHLHTIVVLMQGAANSPAMQGNVLSVADLRRLGQQHDADYPKAFGRVMKSRSEGDVATVIYTSGNSGPAKGTIHRHAGIIHSLRGYRAFFPPGSVDERVCLMPLATVTERLGSELYAVYSGAILNFVEGAETVTENVREVAPTVLIAAPSYWRRLQDSVVHAIEDASSSHQKLYGWAVAIGHRMAHSKREGTRASWLLRCKFAIARMTVLERVRRHLGIQRTARLISTGGTLSEDVARWYAALGARLECAWGLAEAGAFCAGGVAGKSTGTAVGGVLAHNEIAIDPSTQEILVRGGNVFSGYLNASPGSKCSIDASGWLHTGDIGEQDADGQIKLVGRMADSVVLADGTRVLTQTIVNELARSPYISDVVVAGDGQRHLCALVFINEVSIERYAHRHDVPFSDYASLVSSQSIRTLIEREVDCANQRLPLTHRVLSLHILGERLAPGNVEVSAPLRLRRREVLDKYSQLVGSMYE